LKKSAYFSATYVINNEITETDITPHVNFSYKPLNIVQAVTLEKQTNKIDDCLEDKMNLFFDVITNQLASWDLTKDDGTVVDFKNKDELKNISAIVILQIGQIIMAGSKAIETSKDSMLAAIRILNTMVCNNIAKGNVLTPEEASDYELFIQPILNDNPTKDELLKN
jgi:hypothetical protein